MISEPTTAFFLNYMRITDDASLVESSWPGPENLTFKLFLILWLCPLLSKVSPFGICIYKNIHRGSVAALSLYPLSVFFLLLLTVHCLNTSVNGSLSQFQTVIYKYHWWVLLWNILSDNIVISYSCMYVYITQLSHMPSCMFSFTFARFKCFGMLDSILFYSTHK